MRRPPPPPTYIHGDKSMTPDEFDKHYKEWSSGRYKIEGIRLGQYLINKLNNGSPDPDIFYETDDNKAYTSFFSKYVSI